MGKKKFLDKKKSATFQLYARDSADPNYNSEGPTGDRVFVRVDNNYSYTVPGFGEIEEDGEDPEDSIFADAPEDDEMPSFNPIRATSSSTRPSLPDNIRREILELGFPDDGYNYLLHMREIKNTGGGSAYYENSKAIPEPLSLDIKAYDASRVRVSRSRYDGDSNDNSIYNVAAKTVGVRVQKAVDPEVAALLDDDDDLSRFGSDVEDLEEDFVVQANVPEVEEADDVSVDNVELKLQKGISDTNRYFPGDIRNYQLKGENEHVDEKPRVLRPVDEQFDQLCLQEYGTESDSEHGGSMAEDAEESLVEKLNNDVLINHVKDDLSLDGKYKVPADMLRENEGLEKEEYAKLIKRTAELGNLHDNNDDEVTVIEEEKSSDEDENWDCESILTMNSNLDNHPGKIEAPGRKKKLPDFASAVSSGDNMIPLGKEKFPVDYLPNRKSRSAALDKIKEEEEMVIPSHLQRKSGESKEEKKERKAAVKEERREARKAKKELKGIYRCEAQRAQKVAAFSMPSSIRLM